MNALITESSGQKFSYNDLETSVVQSTHSPGNCYCWARELQEQDNFHF